MSSSAKETLPLDAVLRVHIVEEVLELDEPYVRADGKKRIGLLPPGHVGPDDHG
jgi:hypothetical protein